MKTNFQKIYVTLLLAAVVLPVIGCSDATDRSGASSNGVGPHTRKVVLISITSNPESDPQSVNMGLTFAGFCLDEGYEVAIFFNVQGTLLPTTKFPNDFQYRDHSPLKSQLKMLSERGAELHVCPVCMKDLEVSEQDIIDEAFVTSKPKLFANLGSDTMVFTY